MTGLPIPEAGDRVRIEALGHEPNGHDPGLRVGQVWCVEETSESTAGRLVVYLRGSDAALVEALGDRWTIAGPR